MGFRLYPNKITMPRTSGLGQKTIGRVSPVNNIKVPEINNPASFKVAAHNEYTGPVEWASSHKASEKTAASPEKIKWSESFLQAGRNIGAGIGVATAGYVAANAIDTVGRKLKQHFMDKPDFERSFRKALEINPSLKSYDQVELKNYFDLVAEASPTVAKNPLLVSQFLKHLLDYKGTINFTAFSDLAQLEGQLGKNRTESSTTANMLNKSLIEEGVKSMYKGKNYGSK